MKPGSGKINKCGDQNPRGEVREERKTYGDWDAVIMEDEAGVGAGKLAVRHGGECVRA